MSLTRALPSLLRNASRMLVPKTGPAKCLSTISFKNIRAPLTPISREFLALRAQIPMLGQCFRTYSQTTGDQELEHFLDEELEYESGQIQEIPKFNNFNISMDGTEVKLRKQENGEEVVVKFDINENMNVDETPEETSSSDSIPESDIVSYPSFAVLITKPSGKTLEFSCEFNTANEDEDTEEEPELFRFDNVAVYNGDEGKTNIYEAETENMDGNLYGMLMTLLSERGVTAAFVNDLLELSTTVEHRHYVNFLKDLKRFVSNK